MIYLVLGSMTNPEAYKPIYFSIAEYRLINRLSNQSWLCKELEFRESSACRVHENDDKTFSLNLKGFNSVEKALESFKLWESLKDGTKE